MRKVGWFDIYVDDIDRAQSFYESVLQTKLSVMDDPTDATVQMRGFDDDYTSHGAGGALVKLDHAKPGPGGSMVYLFSPPLLIYNENTSDERRDRNLPSRNPQLAILLFGEADFFFHNFPKSLAG